MLLRTDPFRELDRLASALMGDGSSGTWSRPTAMPMDSYRTDDELVIMFDLPGLTVDAIDVNVERNVLTVKAERRPTVHESDVEMQVAERPLGVFSRQLFLSEGLDTDNIHAEYEAGVLSLRIPIAEKAKPRRIEIQAGTEDRKQINA